MASFGTNSTKNINTLHIDLRKILSKAIQIYDFSVIEGLREDARQFKLFEEKKTKLDGIKKRSKHQKVICSLYESGISENGRYLSDDDGTPICSKAADIVPYKKGEDPFESSELNLRRFYFMQGVIFAVAEQLLKDGEITHKVRFGIDWDSDMVYRDQSFHDLPHLELI